MSPSVSMIARSAFGSPPAIARVVLAVRWAVRYPAMSRNGGMGLSRKMVERVEQAGRPV